MRNLVVQVDVDRLSPIAKRELFSSTRERIPRLDFLEILEKGL